MIVMNYLANALPINGQTTGAVSASYPNLFAPAGFTFSIWGVIYTLLLIFSVRQFFPASKEWVGAISWWFAISCLLNAAWIVAWHYERFAVSVLIIGSLLLVLLIISQKVKPLQSGFLNASFGIYLGWVTIATIANITIFFVAAGFNGLGIANEIWVIILLITGTLLILFTVFRIQNPFPALVAVWAFGGIIARQRGNYPEIVYVALACILLIIGLLFYYWFRFKSFAH